MIRKFPVSKRITAIAVALSLGPLVACHSATAVSPTVTPLPQLHARSAAIVDNQGQTVTLRGCNLGNWLLNEMWMMQMWRSGDPKDQWQMEALLKQRFGAQEENRLLDVFREYWIRPRDFKIIKTWGFNLVRLPFNYTLLQDDAAPDKLRPDAFRWLDRAVEMAAEAGIYVILDMHGAPGGQSTDQCTGHSGQNKLWEPNNRKRAAFLWKKIAERYRENPTIAAYDLLNEPYGVDNDATLVETMDQLVHAVREVDQKHLIFCAGSQHGIMMYGPPSSRGWDNIGYTEHFYPGVFGGGERTPDVHARFIGRDLRATADLLRQWEVPFLAGEFNVVFERAGGSAMMRRYYDISASNHWAATMWSYKIVKHDSGCQPDNWYMVTNRDPLSIPDFRTASKDEIESFFKKLGTMDYAQDDELRQALTSVKAPFLALREYPIISGPAPQDVPPDGWKSADLGQPFVKGGQHVLTNDSVVMFGGGRDVFEGNDECHFVWRKAEEHFELGAAVTPPFDTHTYAKAGLMYRTSLKADAPIVITCLLPDGTCTFAFRRQPGARITETRLSFQGKAQALRLVRNGTHFEATALDAGAQPLARQSADLPEFAAAEGVVGFFVLSHDALLLTKSTFTDIEFH
ncbi:MAG TPA: cellulase family glycosylhydrolase [Verrucomicrobiae bacterium]|nr:cellulase family glycosylhydrolase [Verrucomicrobiae bacterium]